MKAYFYIKDTFQNTVVNNGDLYTCKIHTVKVAGVDKLTSDYFSETTNNFQIPLTNWEFSDCTDNGTSIDACGLGGISDSWNPFFSNLNGTYDNVVNSKNRGAFLQSNSTNLYGIEGMGFGFDNLAVPINDLGTAGSSGATSSGAFFVNFDETQDFEFIIRVERQSSLSVAISDIRHKYTYTASTGVFSYTYQDVLPAPPTTPVDATGFAFLSGGNAGWIYNSTGATNNGLGDDPILTRSIGIIAVQPSVPNSVVGQLEGCCYKSPVLADASDTVTWKNDVNGFIFKRNFPSETITLTLEKNGGVASGGLDIPLNSNSYGTFYDFGSVTNFPNYKGYKLEWRNVLILNGEGVYRLRVDSVLLTGTTLAYSVSFELKAYSESRASGTFRIQSIMNGYLANPDFDYSGLNWVDGLRVEGFFGNRQPEYEDERIIFRNRQVKQVRSELINKYTCQTMHIPSCITDSIIEYHNFANVILFTDYNKRNHKNSYIQKEVVLDSIDSIDYKSVTNLAPLQITYKDYVQNYTKENC